MGKIYVIHENDAWVAPLREAFAQQGLPYDEWFLNEGLVDLSESPPDGIFYNRTILGAVDDTIEFGKYTTSNVLSRKPVMAVSGASKWAWPNGEDSARFSTSRCAAVLGHTRTSPSPATWSRPSARRSRAKIHSTGSSVPT